MHILSKIVDLEITVVSYDVDELYHICRIYTYFCVRYLT